MKRRALSVLLSVSVWVPLFVAGAKAQYVVKIMNVDVPFEFYAQGKPYPAGSYVVRREGGLVFLRNRHGDLLSILNSQALQGETPATTSKLVFFQYKGLHLLTQVQWEGDKTSAELVRKGREEEVARRIAPSKVESAEVTSQP